MPETPAKISAGETSCHSFGRVRRSVAETSGFLDFIESRVWQATVAPKLPLEFGSLWRQSPARSPFRGVCRIG